MKPTDAPFIKVQKLSGSRPITMTVLPLHLAVYVFDKHLPDVDGDKADWLAQELFESGGVYETETGCTSGHSVRFSEAGLKIEASAG